MNQLNHIATTWQTLDAALEEERVEAQNSGDTRKEARISDRQRVNDHAYFVLCFGQLESHIRTQVATLIRDRQNRNTWAERRGWEPHNPERVQFELALTLVTDKGGRDYRRISNLYRL